jgi:hypothetical protein
VRPVPEPFARARLPGSAATPVSERGGKKAGRRLLRERDLCSRPGAEGVIPLLFSAVGVFSELSEAQDKGGAGDASNVQGIGE